MKAVCCLALLALVGLQVEANIVPYIVGGNVSAKGRWPWQLSMMIDPYGSGDYVHSCGAVVIDQWHALCAAHCFMGMDPRYHSRSLQIKAGAFNLDNDDADQTVGVRSWTSHSGFGGNKPGMPDDIAIIHLSQPLDFWNPNIKPIKLAADNHDFSTNSNCWITGWGRTSGRDRGTSPLLRELNIPVFTNTECRRRWNRAPIPSTYKAVLDTHICIGDQFGKKGACQGDSGGPLVCRLNNGQWVLSGITSRGWPDCEIYPSVYTRVSKFLNWINSAVGKRIPTA